LAPTLLGNYPVGFIRAYVWALTAASIAGLCAQTPDADRMAPATRAGQIEQERQQKAQHLAPETPSGIEHALNVIKQKHIVERITSGIAGFRVHMGGLITGSGFALGPEYYRRDLLDEQLTVRASIRGSTRKFYLMDSEFDLPRLAHDHVFVNLYGVHRSYSHIDYYGPGPNSAKSGRSDWGLEDTSFQLRTGVQPVHGLRMGGIGRYLLVNVFPGRDHRFAPTQDLYTEQTAPGIQFQTNYAIGGGFVQYDWRDNPGGPRRGGNYIAQYTTYSDIRRERYAFDRLDIEAQQYIPFFNQRRVIALRGRVEATSPHEGNLVPFYLQPTLGGSEDLRGYRPFRFYDNNAVVLNGEYRWEVFSGLDMALFVDGGQVFNDWHQINYRHLKADAGFGFRFNVRNDVFLRLDTGFSREGFQIWVKFNNVF
jgi:outer membrane protein assembly factor BamA